MPLSSEQATEIARLTDNEGPWSDDVFPEPLQEALDELSGTDPMYTRVDRWSPRRIDYVSDDAVYLTVDPGGADKFEIVGCVILSFAWDRLTEERRVSQNDVESISGKGPEAREALSLLAQLSGVTVLSKVRTGDGSDRPRAARPDHTRVTI